MVDHGSEKDRLSRIGKAGDSNAHEVHLKYFGKVTRKSSTSFDVAVGRQTPRSDETPKVKSVKVGAGYIWQWTPKTQIVIQAIRSLQNSTSEEVVGGAEDESVKSDSHFTNDALSISLNSRLHSKLFAIFTASIAHVKSKVEKDGDETTEERTFTFPLNFTLNYAIKRWAQLRLSYTGAISWLIYNLMDAPILKPGRSVNKSSGGSAYHGFCMILSGTTEAAGNTNKASSMLISF